MKSEEENDEKSRILQQGHLLEPDDDDLFMLVETANQLRDDAFIFITNLSPSVTF